MPRGGNNRINNRVMEHMVDNGLRVGDLAEACGLTVSHVSAIHGGRILPTVHVALGIARSLGTDVETLWGGGLHDEGEG